MQTRAIYTDHNGTEHAATIEMDHGDGVVSLTFPNPPKLRNGAEFVSVDFCRKGSARGEWREVAAKAEKQSSKREGAVTGDGERKARPTGDAAE